MKSAAPRVGGEESLPGAACRPPRPVLIGHRQRERPRGKPRCPDAEIALVVRTFFIRRLQKVCTTSATAHRGLSGRTAGFPRGLSLCLYPINMTWQPGITCSTVPPLLVFVFIADQKERFCKTLALPLGTGVYGLAPTKPPFASHARPLVQFLSKWFDGSVSHFLV